MNIVNNFTRSGYTQTFLTNTNKKPGKDFTETAKESFSGTLAGEKTNAKKEKKHTLFTSESGVFSHKTLAETAAQCSAEVTDSMGILTEEQIADFKEKYDVENLSGADYEQLLTDLVEQNIISQQDKEKQFFKSAPATAMIVAADDRAFAYEPGGNNRLQMLRQEMAKYQAYIDAIENGRCSVHGASLWETKRFYEEEYAYTKRIADILEQLKSSGTKVRAD